MKRIKNLVLALALIVSVLMPTYAKTAFASTITTTPTGYTSAEDVKYVKSGSTVLNWGARGEDCVFLSTYAQDYYVGDYAYNVLSANKGGSTQANAHNSALYSKLSAMLTAKHTKQTTYGDTRYLFCYTDCVSNDKSKISSFYSGEMFNSTWDSGATWNREHTWPASKSLSGRPGNGDAGEGADIMMVRPTLKSENGSRGNTAYGEGSKFYEPADGVKGDCARIVLYVYTRWKNSTHMWGSGGVMESMDILLKWMEEDPVDTWEMGKNDSIQSITGVRNVFVDYPEYAWLLFGKEIPSDITTPSSSSSKCEHTYDDGEITKEPTCGKEGVRTYTCTKCGDVKEEAISATGNHSYDNGVVTKEPTCAEGVRTYTCTKCGETREEAIAATGNHSYDEGVVTKEPTCAEGVRTHTCINCGETKEESIPAIEGYAHSFGNWYIDQIATQDKPAVRARSCKNCGLKEYQSDSGSSAGSQSSCQSSLSIPYASVILLFAGYTLLKKKKQ